MLDTTDNREPAKRQGFCIKEFKDRDDWMRSIIASDLYCGIKVIATRLALYLNVKSGRCDPAVATVARETGTSRKTVQRAIGKLEAEGWLKVTRSRGGKSLNSNGYTHSFSFLNPNGVTSDAVDGPATASNEATNGVKAGGATVSNEAVYRVTGDAQTERTAKGAIARSGHDHRSKQSNQRFTTWPADLTLNREMISFATSKGFNTDRARTIFEKFKYHHQAKGSRLADWTAAWHGWVVNQVDIDAKNKPQNSPDLIDWRA